MRTCRHLLIALLALVPLALSLYPLSAPAQTPAAPQTQLQDSRSRGQTLYLPIYSHLLYGNLDRKGQPAKALLSALVSIRNTDGKRPIRITAARYFDTPGQLLRNDIPTPRTIPPYGTIELFVALHDEQGGSGANYVISWEADTPANPPLIEALHVNMDGGRALSVLTRGIPIQTD
jgi:hypothetical protein